MNMPGRIQNNRFDYVRYDGESLEIQTFFKALFIKLDTEVEHAFKGGRAKALIHTKLEEAYMWVGKAIRDEQIERDALTKLQEERDNS